MLAGVLIENLKESNVGVPAIDRVDLDHREMWRRHASACESDPQVRLTLAVHRVADAARYGTAGIESGRVCYWGGWGGSVVLNDTANNITMSYVMNRMQLGIIGNETSFALVESLFGLLD